MLPLSIGMRVALTDHIDRSPEKLLLRGRTGTVHSWIWDEHAQQPKVVYVKFDNSDNWALDGTPAPGIYPIYPVKREWYLDAKRKRSLLKITRKQLPLTPAYAMTAHASQGKTLRAVLLDLNVDKRVDATFGTVAASRVRSREDVLILRPFPLWLFNRGENEGPALLLQTLRGEEVDWQAHREARYPTAACTSCKQTQALDAFDVKQWERARANRDAKCMQCKHGDQAPRKRKLPSGTAKIQCDGCKRQKIEDAFPRAQLSSRTGKPRCLSCVQQLSSLQCALCKATKPVEAFSSSMVTVDTANILCQECRQANQHTNGPTAWTGCFTCRTCGDVFANDAPYRPKRGYVSQQRCSNCSNRDTRQKDLHTCRNRLCQRKWYEKQGKSEQRKRYCPQCRAR